MGMAPLAAFLQEDGNDVSGFDNNPNAEVKKYLQNEIPHEMGDFYLSRNGVEG